MPRTVRNRARRSTAALCGLALLGCQPAPTPAPEPAPTTPAPEPPKPGARVSPVKPKVDMQ